MPIMSPGPGTIHPGVHSDAAVLALSCLCQLLAVGGRGGGGGGGVVVEFKLLWHLGGPL